MRHTPFLVVLHITGKCNLKCSYCYANQYDPINLKFAYIKDVLEQAKKIGSKNIIFSGGEPLLHPKFYKSLEYGFNRGFEIHVTSNGTLIDEECVNKLKSVDAKVTISIDGSSPKINDSLRGPGTFKKAINAVESLVDSNIYTSMRMTLLKSNLGDLRNYIELAIDKGVDRCIIERMTLMDNESDLSSLEPSADDMFQAFEIISEYKDSNEDIKIGSNDPLLLVFDQGEIKDHLNKHYICGGCTAAVAAVSINPDLTVTPCPRLPIICGDLQKHSLRHIWEKSRVFQNLRNRDFFMGCNSCNFKYICGGCRGAAYAHGSYLGKDPQCWRLKSEVCTNSY